MSGNGDNIILSPNADLYLNRKDMETVSGGVFKAQDNSFVTNFFVTNSGTIYANDLYLLNSKNGYKGSIT
jgi:hypothetical protein